MHPLIIAILFSLPLFAQDIDLDDLAKLEQNSLVEGKEEQLNRKAEGKPTLEKLDQQTQEDSEEDIPDEEKIFGMDFIDTSPTSISALADLPVPGDYKISFNDVIRIVMSGTDDKILSVAVGLDGSILIPEIGSIQVVGQTFQELKENVNTLFKKVYVDVDVYISLEELSAKKINILGAVKSPGTYLVNPFTTISNSLAYSGGVEDYASLRNIKLVKSNGIEHAFDLYDFLIYGNRSKDLTIGSGDTILVTSTNKFVQIKGQVFRPMIYEYKENDKFIDLINFAQGFTKNAQEKDFYALENDNGILVSGGYSLGETISNRQLERIYIGSEVVVANKGIQIFGSAVSEKTINREDVNNISEVLNKLQFSSDIYPFYVQIKQNDKLGLFTETKNFSLSDPSSYKNISLKNNVEMYFLSRKDIDDNDEYFSTLKIKEVSEENENLDFGSLEKSQNEEEEIKLKTTLNFDINPSNIKIVNFGSSRIFIPLAGKIVPKQIYEFFGPDLDLIANKVSLSSVDSFLNNVFETQLDSDNLFQVFFPDQNPSSIEVEIVGQVANPGKYTLTGSITLNDLYTLAGDLTERADKSSIFFSRESIKKREMRAVESSRKTLYDSLIANMGKSENSQLGSIEGILELSEGIQFNGRLSGDLSPNSNLSLNTFLENGDKIIIYPRSTTINVIGEVLQPLTTIFEENKTYLDYINQAGGMTSYADKRSIYVIKSNGTSVPVDNNLFSKSIYPEPGDTIVIPRDYDRLELAPAITLATTIISNIAFAAASLNAIR